MPFPKAPCKDCDKRHIGCHSECGPYKEFRAAVDDISTKRREETEKNIRVRSKAHGKMKYFKQKV